MYRWKHLNNTIQMDDKTFDHRVTEQDMQNNPELAEAGVQVGEVIGIPAEDTNPPEEEAALATSPESAGE
jgi:hypothetical protein